MIVLKTIAEIVQWRDSRPPISVGFVPTMGALHEGHLELLKQSKKENSQTVLSIFVNPTQFNDPKDLEKYPRPIEKDIEYARSVGTDVVILPQSEQMYPDQYNYQLKEKSLSLLMEGEFRPGHFDGMLTVVLKLLMLANADRAYFGEKDFQQLQLVKGMTEAFFLKTQIVPVPTVREHDGLAMSSRNIRLSKDERELAGQLNKILRKAMTPELAAQELATLGMTVEYVQDRFGRRLSAVKIGNVRLIDNVELNN